MTASADIIYPDGAKSLRDIHLSKGMGAVHAIVEANHKAVENERIFRMSELPKIVPPKPHRLGMGPLDDHYRIREGDFTVVTGIPSHGKSTFINEIACRMALDFGWTTAFASFEQLPQVDHRRALRTFFNRALEIHQSPEELARADRWIDGHFSFIVPDDDDEITLGWVLDCCEAAILRHRAKLIVIDPWNEMDHVRPPDMTLTEYTGFAIKEFRRLAHKYRVHVIVAAHPAKQRKLDNGSYPIPTLYDISDSAHWANKCDAGIVIHRQDQITTIIRVAKSRYHSEIGVPGDVEAHFDRGTARYEIVEPMRGYEP